MKIKKTYLLLIAFTTINLQLITHVSQAQIGFDPAVSFPAGNYPTSVTSADFNGDSKADLAITRNDGSVKILLGNGFGSFGTSDSVIVGTGPCSIISADFNGDGKTDLAVANSHSNNVSILLGNGTGGFGAATNFPVIGFPYSIISADFNGDGKADLAIANGYWYSNYVSVLLANDTSGFGAATNFVVGSNPCSVISADFNGDGKADLAIANMWSSNVSVLLGNGLGGFGAATAFGVETGLNQSLAAILTEMVKPIWQRLTAVAKYLYYLAMELVALAPVLILS